MALYLIQASYSTASIASMVKTPQDRSAVVRTMLERAGGKLLGFWRAFAEHDVIAVAEVPDNVSAAALSMAIGASGSMSSYRTTALLSVEESVAAMKKAGEVAYQPPK